MIFVLLAVWLVLTVGSLAIVTKVVLMLPEDYFVVEQAPGDTRWTSARVARNVAGIVLVLIGAVLSVPGIPGQGLLTILVGLFLVDFPGRRRLEHAIARRPGVLTTLNRLRERFGYPKLQPPPPY